MKPILTLSALAAVLVFTPSQSYALETIEIVTKERAKELGLQMRVTPSGLENVRVELEFETKGQLKGYRYVVLEMKDGEKTLVSSVLKEEKTESGHIIVSFEANRAKLGQITVKVVEMTTATRAGHVMRVKEFVE
jgi:hypothetical protein